jgi:flagellar hook protein FlgE
MLSTLASGVSGMRAANKRIDVVANNIANANTVGYKASRVQFREAFTELVRAASRPSANYGGTNPMQIGTGVEVAAVETLFTQGNLESTGRVLDLAIQGQSFFKVRGREGYFYTRAGNWQLDADGHMLMPGSGHRLQGVMADVRGNLSAGAPVVDIRLPVGLTVPANATSMVDLAGNLNSDAEPSPTILRTRNRVFAIEQSTSNGGAGSNVNGLYARGVANRAVTNLTPGNGTITISDGTLSVVYTYGTNGAASGVDRIFTSLNDLIAEVNNDFGASFTAAMDDTTGAIVFTGVAASSTLAVTSNNSILLQAFSSVNGVLLAAATVQTDEFSHAATDADLLTNLRNANGISLGVVNGDVLDIDGNVGGNAVATGTLAVGPATTYGDLQVAIDVTLGLGTQAANVDVLDNGALEIIGDAGTPNAISQMNIRTQGATAPGFDAIFNATPGNYLTVQDAADVTHELGVKIYDSLGTAYDLTMAFQKDPLVPNRWTWEVTVNPPGINSLGTTGFVSFTPDGLLEIFEYDNGATAYTFNPVSGGANPVSIDIRGGVMGNLEALTQYAAPSTAIAVGQDGYKAGQLQSIAVDDKGVVTGLFTNGLNLDLAQITMVDFNNPSGLQRIGDSLWATTSNSGLPREGFSGSTSVSSITSGALEVSNVDLPQEFATLIGSQRHFQASARAITTADEMLQEIVSLKR